MFGIKDLFTTVNLLGGVVAICLCVEGRPFAAGLAVMLGYLGDAVDGWVARKLGTSNRFGAEFDAITDHLSQAIAPAAIVYVVYRDAPLGIPHTWTHAVAGTLAASIMVTTTIRHARNVVRPVRFAGAWVGLPRTVLGFLAVALANSRLLPFMTGGYWIGVVVIPALGVAGLTDLPFANHRLGRHHFWYVRVLIGAFFVTTFGILAWRPAFMFDLLAFWMIGYTLAGWMSLKPEELRDFRRAVATAQERAQT